MSGASGSVIASTNAHHRVVGRLGEPIGVHLAQLGQPLVPQLGVPGVLVAVGAEAHLHVELGHRGDPAAERLEQLHLGPLVVADATCRLLDVERARAARAGPTARTVPSACADRPRVPPLTLGGQVTAGVDGGLPRRTVAGAFHRRRRVASCCAAEPRLLAPSPSGVAGGPPSRYSSSIARHGAVTSSLPRIALTPHTTRSRITKLGGMLSLLDHLGVRALDVDDRRHRVADELAGEGERVGEVRQVRRADVVVDRLRRQAVAGPEEADLLHRRHQPLGIAVHDDRVEARVPAAPTRRASTA